jgi:hypothetical protein
MQQAQLHRYIFCVENILDDGWSDWFVGWEVMPSVAGAHGTTLIGSVRDQSELHGLLGKIRDLNLTLISLQRAEPLATAHP